MRSPAAIAAFATGFLAAGSANATVIFSGLKNSDCESGVVPNARLRDVALADAKVPMSTELATALLQSRLGTIAAQKSDDCTRVRCEGTDLALANLNDNLLDLANDAPPAPTGFTATVDPAHAPAATVRPRDFLNGDWYWVSVTCTAAVAHAAKPEPRAPRPSDVDAPELVFAKEEADIGKDFKKRGFASIGVSSDREAKTTTWDVDAYLGYTAPFLGHGTPIEFQPFASLQYHTGKKKVDDFAVGGAVLWYPNNGGWEVALKGAWESDHKLKSSLWRADLGVTPPWFDFCESWNVPGKSFARCEITGIGDFEDVANPGDKTDLATRNNFGRLGVDGRFSFGWSLGKGIGFGTIAAGVSSRWTVWGSHSNATLWTASVGLTPSDSAHWKVSIDYSRGRDLTDLSRQHKIVLTVGVRQ